MIKLLFIILIVFLVLSMCVAYECDSFTVYYISLNTNFFVPPTPESIERSGVKIVLTSCALTELFQNVNDSNLALIRKEDYMGLMNLIRIKIIRDKDKKVVYITAEKNILSEGKKYNIDKKIIEAALDEIIKACKK